MSQFPALMYCSVCGHALAEHVPDGDHAPRKVCPSCQTVHYQNPKVIVGVIPEAPDGRVLLCRRNIEPRLGCWTFPAGFMELGETSAQGAAREAEEESGIQVAVRELLTVMSVPYVHQVHINYRGEYDGVSHRPTPESSEVALYAEENIPWTELAFPSIVLSLKHYFACRSAQRYVAKNIDLHRPAKHLSMQAWLEGQG